MSDKESGLFPLVELALGVVKDVTIHDSLKRIQEAHREYLLECAKANRKKTDAVIKAMQKLDIERLRLESEYRRLENVLSDEASCNIVKIIQHLEHIRKQMVMEKNSIVKNKLHS